ncbi:MAG: HAD family hydrolase [Candidatus Thorarchaeota archaeon]
MPMHPLKDCRGISFDIGGTLIDPFIIPVFEVHKKFIHQVCGDNYRFTDEAISKATSLADEEIWKLVTQQEPNYFFSEDDWIERNRLVLVHLGVNEHLDEFAREYQTLWNNIIAANPDKLKPDAIETLEQLQGREYKLAISTNWADPRERLTSLGIWDFFHSIQHSIVPGYRKPSPYMLIQNAHELGVNPLNCAFVGDDIDRDVPAAKRAGMHPILLLNDDSPETIPSVNVTVIRELIELLELFE